MEEGNFAQTGQPIMGKGSDGKAYIFSIDLATGQMIAQISSSGYGANPTVTRPANTTPYTAGDVVGGAITFTNMGPAAGGQIIINLVALEIDVASVPSG